jgi:hypothetical protein
MADVVTVAGSLSCPDLGRASLTSSAKLTVSSQAVVLYAGLTAGPPLPFAGCTFQVSGASNPCLGVNPTPTGQAATLTAGGQAVLLADLVAKTANNQLPITVSAGQAKLTAA